MLVMATALGILTSFGSDEIDVTPDDRLGYVVVGSYRE